MSFDLEKANIVKSLILTRAQAGATLTEIKGILIILQIYFCYI